MNTYALWRALHSVFMLITLHLIHIRNCIFILHEELPIVICYDIHIVIINILMRIWPGMNLVLKWNIVRCYSDLKPNIPTRNCIGSLHSQNLCK